MSCAIFTGLAYASARYGWTNEKIERWMSVLAVGSLLLAPILAWWEQDKKVEQLEAELKTTQPQFEFELGPTIWVYDTALDKTIFFTLGSILNKGHASVTQSWSATYRLGPCSEAMVSFFLRPSYTVTIGHEVLTLTTPDLLNAKTAENMIQRGQRVNGRLLFTLPGDRRSQIASTTFEIEIKCHDFLGVAYTAKFHPATEPLTALVTHAHENSLRTNTLTSEVSNSTPSEKTK